MSIKKLIEKANDYDDQEWVFSSAFIWEKVVKKNPIAFHLYQCANQTRLAGNYKRAHQLLKKIDIEEMPADYRFNYFVQLGQLYEAQGKINLAIKAYKKSLKFEVDVTYPYIFLACLLCQKGKLNKAKKLFEIALTKEGDIDEAYYNLSMIYAQKGKLNKATKFMKKCLAIDKKYPNAKNMLRDFRELKKLKGYVKKVKHVKNPPMGHDPLLFKRTEL